MKKLFLFGLLMIMSVCCVFGQENILDAIGHDWDDGVIDPLSSCNAHGTKTYTCQNDSSHTYTEEISPDPDNHIGEKYLKDEKSPTCTQVILTVQIVIHFLKAER